MDKSTEYMIRNCSCERQKIQETAWPKEPWFYRAMDKARSKYNDHVTLKVIIDHYLKFLEVQITRKLNQPLRLLNQWMKYSLVSETALYLNY